ncbi:unnamed protein product [Symbiodinium sp. CCMP2456]|nr:unnamed protein product [Symbiodinium sp. CCMP2456]
MESGAVMDRVSAGPLPLQRAREKLSSLQSGSSTPTSSLRTTTVRSGSPPSPTASSNTSRQDGAEEPRGEGQGVDARTPKVLWAATPTPKATEAPYSFALPPTESSAFLNADAKVFVPVVQQCGNGPVSAASEDAPDHVQNNEYGSEHLEAQAVMMAESVLGLDSEGLLSPPAPDTGSQEPVPTGPVPSKGSALHRSGQCRPCAWMWKPKGCQNAENCEYCHLCPEGELKHRKKLKIAAIRMGALGPSSHERAGKAAPRRDLKLSSLL